MHREVERLLGPSDGFNDGAAVSAHARDLAGLALFHPAAEARRDARYVLRIAARKSGAWFSSIAALYEARGRGEVAPDFTVPAINVRGMTFDVAAACFRAMTSTQTAAAVFELNRAEVEFTAQSPRDFATCVLAAALAEGWQGPVFIQLDHLMANAKAFADDPEAETQALERLIRYAVQAGFYNVDIDASTLVDLSQPTVEAQQRPNIDVTARLARYVRAVEPPGVRISIGGEIGEVGGHNSTREELEAFVDGYNRAAPDAGGLTKVSVQTGTRHGGVRRADGSSAEMALDFDTLEVLSTICREQYGMAGAVQHGASTLPEAAFGRFPEVGCAEVHLATGFQDLVLDHPAFPAEIRAAMEVWSLEDHARERRDGETDAQFVRRARRRAWGPFKEECWGIEASRRAEIGASLEARFAELFRALRVEGGAVLVERWVTRQTRRVS
jgi:fructose/tagatose bisphosphate aldolase